MTTPLYVTPQPLTGPVVPGGAEVADLLRQLLAVQQEQVGLLRAQQAAQDHAGRMRAFLGRWAGEFPGVGGACREVLPALERAYLTLVRDLTDRVKDLGGDLDDEFVLTEFLDRYGMRLAQLGAVVGQLGPIADAAPPDPPPV